MSTIENGLSTSKLASSKEYREAFVAAFLKRYIPFQIRTIRQKREMSQQQLAEASKVTQGVISRAEDPDYGNLTLNTVLRIAGGFDLAFVGKFVRFSELVTIVDQLSEESLDLPSFAEECREEFATIDRPEPNYGRVNDAELAVTNLLQFPGHQQGSEVGPPTASGNAACTGVMSGIAPSGNDSTGIAMKIPPQGQSSWHQVGSAWKQ